VNQEYLPMIHQRLAWAVVLVLGLFVTGVGAKDFLALGQSADGPIRISSKKVSARNVPGGKEVTYDGNVGVTQGKLSLECEKLVIVYDEERAKPASNGAKRLPKELETISNLKSISATGKVIIRQEERMATAGKAMYDNTKRTITLSEGPRLWQGKDQVVADMIVIYLDENKVEVSSDKGKDIVTTIHPGKQPPEKDKEK
jgi:lipopolysaccharide transport protein LptA